MIGCIYHNCIVPNFFLHQMPEEAAQLMVYVCYHPVIYTPGFAELVNSIGMTLKVTL